MQYLKRLFAFVGALIVVLSIYGANNVAQAGKSQVRSQSVKSTGTSAAPTASFYASQLDKLGINLHQGSEQRPDSRETAQTSTRCKSIVYQTLQILPRDHQTQLTDLTLFYTNDGRRGFGGGGSIILRCLNVTDNELKSVFTHEMGHLVDAGYLTGSLNTVESGFYDFDVPVAQDDPSAYFFRISWISSTQKLADVSELDFVSLYAATDPFEDFAETYTYYRWHGPEFRALAATNNRLYAKYNFMRDNVFDGKEFGNLNLDPDVNPEERDYDVTVLPIL